MKILVGVKRVVDYAIKVRVKGDNSGVELAGVKQSMNPFCEIAIEEAVRLKERKYATEIIALTVGPKQNAETLRTALALGADRAIHILTELRIDQALQPLHVAQVLQKIVERDQVSLVLLGKQAIDDDYNQTGQMLAGLLGWPQATFASKVEVKEGNVIEVIREIDGGLQTVLRIRKQQIQFQLPGVITCDLRLNQPRFASVPNIMKAKQKKIEEIQLDALGIKIGQSLKVLKTEAPKVRQGGVVLDSVDSLIDKLRNEAKVL